MEWKSSFSFFRKFLKILQKQTEISKQENKNYFRFLKSDTSKSESPRSLSAPPLRNYKSKIETFMNAKSIVGSVMWYWCQDFDRIASNAFLEFSAYDVLVLDLWRFAFFVYSNSINSLSLEYAQTLKILALYRLCKN